jgi:hypothetical protein
MALRRKIEESELTHVLMKQLEEILDTPEISWHEAISA